MPKKKASKKLSIREEAEKIARKRKFDEPAIIAWFEEHSDAIPHFDACGGLATLIAKESPPVWVIEWLIVHGADPGPQGDARSLRTARRGPSTQRAAPCRPRRLRSRTDSGCSTPSTSPRRRTIGQDLLVGATADPEVFLALWKESATVARVCEIATGAFTVLAEDPVEFVQRQVALCWAKTPRSRARTCRAIPRARSFG